LRYNTSSDFNSQNSWESYNANHTAAELPDTVGFRNAIYIPEGYVIFIPFFDGTYIDAKMVRYTLSEPFLEFNSWCSYDAGNSGDLYDTTGYNGAVSDGNFMYFSPVSHGKILKYAVGNRLIFRDLCSYQDCQSGTLTISDLNISSSFFSVTNLDAGSLVIKDSSVLNIVNDFQVSSSLSIEGGTLIVGRNLTFSSSSTITLNSGKIQVKGCANLGGNLKLAANPVNNSELVNYQCQQGKFDSIKIDNCTECCVTGQYGPSSLILLFDYDRCAIDTISTILTSDSTILTSTVLISLLIL